MQKQDYLPDARQKIADAVLRNASDGSTITSHRFNLVSANLFRYMPHIGFGQHFKIYTEIMLHNQFTHYEQTHIDVLNSITVENVSNELIQLMRTRPCIITSFHFGMYRLMNLFLTKNQIPYTIVIPKESFKKEGHIIKDIYQKMNSELSADSIRFIEMESPTLSLKMVRELKEGRNLFIYFDGYRGTGNLQENRRYSEDGTITLLGQPLLARVGVAYLAQMAGVPLITGISYRKSLNDLRLKFFDPVYPNSGFTREQFAHNTTQELYNQFGSYLTTYPGQWEAWLYLHRSLPPNDLQHTDSSQNLLRPNFDEKFKGSFQLNHNKFGVFKIQDKAYLFNKRTYTSYPIEDKLFELLKSAANRVIKPALSDYSAIPSLIDSNILVPYAA